MDRNEALYTAILEGDRAAAQAALRAALDRDGAPLALLQDSMIPALTELGDRFARGDALLPDLMVGARAMQRVTDRRLRVVFALFLLVVGARLLIFG